MLTPTLKLRRDQVDARFAVHAEALARSAAGRSEVLIEWDTA